MDWMRAPGHTLHALADWRELVKSWHGGYDFIPAVVRPEMPDAVQRAVAAGAQPPLDFVGAGMTGIVFCDASSPPIGFKVARHKGSSGPLFLEEEAEWLRDASRIPGVREHVVSFIRYDRENEVLVRECAVLKDSDNYRRGSRVGDLYARMGKLMRQYNWSMPEFKDDSFIVTRRGPILVDASMPHRLGRRMVEYVLDVLAGRRPLPGNPKYSSEAQRWKDLAFYTRREITDKAVPRDIGNRVIQKIMEREPSAAEWLSE